MKNMKEFKKMFEKEDTGKVFEVIELFDGDGNLEIVKENRNCKYFNTVRNSKCLTNLVDYFVKFEDVKKVDYDRNRLDVYYKNGVRAFTVVNREAFSK